MYKFIPWLDCTIKQIFVYCVKLGLFVQSLMHRLRFDKYQILRNSCIEEIVSRSSQVLAHIARE